MTRGKKDSRLEVRPPHPCVHAPLPSRSGYATTDDGQDYWLVKNIWSTHWASWCQGHAVDLAKQSPELVCSHALQRLSPAAAIPMLLPPLDPLPLHRSLAPRRERAATCV